MPKTIALIDNDGNVVNTAEFADTFINGVWDGYITIDVTDAAVSIGWTYANGVFSAPPVESLIANPNAITSAQTTTVTYTNTYSDAPTEAIFTVNNVTATVALTNGTAELDVTPSGVGDIVVSVNRPIPAITVGVY